jgi:hypothetical protein
MDSTDTLFEPDVFNFVCFGITAAQRDSLLVAMHILLYEPQACSLEKLSHTPLR